jgi:Holliday junction resolvase RusA-like endonuclease
MGGLDPMPSRSQIAELYRQRTGRELVLDGVVPAAAAPSPRPALVREAIAWPFTITLPWSCLVSDNEKHRAQLRGTGPSARAIMVITRHYATAEEKIHALALQRMNGAAPADCPLALTARVWMPDNRIHDLTNSCKLVHDALERAVYENDRWLHDVHWIRAGVDVDAPRAEITIVPLPSPA